MWLLLFSRSRDLRLEAFAIVFVEYSVTYYFAESYRSNARVTQSRCDNPCPVRKCIVSRGMKSILRDFPVSACGFMQDGLIDHEVA
jgi:hypothetical protein